MASAPADTAAASLLPAVVPAQFRSLDGVAAGPPLALPLDVTPADLERLLNKLLQSPDGELLPYSFFVADPASSNAASSAPLPPGSRPEHYATTEIRTTLRADAFSVPNGASPERLLTIVFRPLALFRVRPVTRCSASLPGHTDAVLSVHYSHNGALVASGSGDCTVRIWDPYTSTPVCALRRHTKWVLSVAWSPDSRFVASGDLAGMLLVWHIDPKVCSPKRTPEPVLLNGHKNAVTALAWEPLAPTASSTTQFTPLRLCSASRDGTLRVWNAAVGRLIFAMTQHTASVTCVRWGAAGLIYSGSQDRTVKVWSAVDGRLFASLDAHGHWVNSMALSTDYINRTNDRTKTLRRKQNSGAATTAAAAGDPAGSKSKALESDGGPRELAERLVTASDDFTLILWRPDTSTKPIARMTGHQAAVNCVVFSPSAQYIASASFDKSVKLWDAYSGKIIHSFRAHVSPVYQVVFSADSRLLLSCSKDSTCKVWDIRERKLRVDLPGHADEVYAIDWSPTGETACSGSKDRTLKIWRQ